MRHQFKGEKKQAFQWYSIPCQERLLQKGIIYQSQIFIIFCAKFDFQFLQENGFWASVIFLEMFHNYGKLHLYM